MSSLVKSRSRAALIALFFLMLAGFPLLDQPFYTELVTRVMILSMFAISLDLLAGATVEYIESLGGAAFRVTNPQAASGCGCGSSFAV